MFLRHPLSCLPGTCRSSVYSWMKPGCEKRGLWCDGSWFWKSSWANTSMCLKIWSAGKTAIEDVVLQAHVGKVHPNPAVLPWCTQVLIQSLPALPQGPLVGHDSYKVKPNWGRKGNWLAVRSWLSLSAAVVEQIIPNTCIAEARNRAAFDLGSLV